MTKRELTMRVKNMSRDLLAVQPLTPQELMLWLQAAEMIIMLIVRIITILKELKDDDQVPDS